MPVKVLQCTYFIYVAIAIVLSKEHDQVCLIASVMITVNCVVRKYSWIEWSVLSHNRCLIVLTFHYSAV